jgi:hypothetical protein
MMAGIGTDQFALVTQPIAAFVSGVTLRLPVDVRVLAVRGDELARDRTESIELRPLRVFAPSERLSADVARRAARYGSTAVFFLDERSFPEPNAFWVGGQRTASVVIAPEQPSDAVELVLRNGASANTVAIAAGRREQSVQLAPGEERRVEIPLDRARGAVLVTLTSAAGFRPSDVDPHSRDSRFLGVSVRIEP